MSKRRTIAAATGILLAAAAGQSIWSADASLPDAAELAERTIRRCTTGEEIELPPGTIVMWSWPADTIPDGWALCDGRNGTPDLRDRFVLAAGETPPGSREGTTDHTHAAVPHSHAVTPSSHSHSIGSATYSTSVNGSHTHTTGGPSATIGVDTASGSSVAGASHTHSVGANGSHSHNTVVSGQNAAATTPPSFTSGVTAATSQPSDHLPPFYRIAFIMKLPN